MLVGAPHGVTFPGEELFYSHVGLHGGPAPVRRFLPELTDLVWNDEIDAGKVSRQSLLAKLRSTVAGTHRLPSYGDWPL